MPKGENALFWQDSFLTLLYCLVTRAGNNETQTRLFTLIKIPKRPITLPRYFLCVGVCGDVITRFFLPFFSTFMRVYLKPCLTLKNIKGKSFKQTAGGEDSEGHEGR